MQQNNNFIHLNKQKDTLLRAQRELVPRLRSPCPIQQEANEPVSIRSKIEQITYLAAVSNDDVLFRLITPPFGHVLCDKYYVLSIDLN